MAWRFSKRVRLFPGVTLNIGKGAPSLSVGPRGAKLNVGKRGARYTVGIPGTGLSYTDKLFPGSQKPKKASLEEACLSAAQALAQGDSAGVESSLAGHRKMPDAALALGVMAMNRQCWDDGARLFEQSLQAGDKLGRPWVNVGVTQFGEMAVALGMVTKVEASVRGAMIGRTECLQRSGLLDQAVASLVPFSSLYPNDLVIKTMLADLLMDRNATGDMQSILSLCAGQVVPLPETAPLLFIIANAYEATGRHQQAIAISKAVLNSRVAMSNDLQDEYTKLR